MSFTFDECGVALTETRDGCTMPAVITFDCVNDFVHRLDTSFEDLQSLCLGLVSEIERLRRDGV